VIVDRVADGDLDLALSPERPPHPGAARQEVFSSRWVLWCSSTHPLARKKSIRWDDLRKVPLVAAGRDYESRFASIPRGRSADTPLIATDVVDNITTALGVAAQGLAVTLAPAYVSIFARPLGLVLREIDGEKVLRPIFLYRPALRSISPAAEAFGEFLVDWAKRWNAALAARTRSRSAHPSVRTTRCEGRSRSR
jgi:DNA-binding transcriptional LysR family regulator